MKKGSVLRTLRFIFITVVLFVLSFSAVVVTVLNVYVPEYLARIDGEEVGYFSSPAQFDEIYEKLVEEKKADGLAVEVYLAADPEFELKYVRGSAVEEQNQYTNVREFVKAEYTVYNVKVKDNVEMTFATKEEADTYAEKIKKAVKSTVKSTVLVEETKTEEIVETTEKASANEIYTDLVSRYKPVVRTYTTSNWVTGKALYGSRAPGVTDTFISGGTRPATGGISQNYGPSAYYTNGMHTGIDIASSGGARVDILSYKAGTVISAGWNGSYGYCVIVSHGSDSEGNEFRTLYAHMSSISVSVGQSVSQGAVLGKMGSTGYSTGTHLHFEIRVITGGNTKFYNPGYYI